MIKKIIISVLTVILVGAVGVGAYDAYQGNSSLSLPENNVFEANAAGQFQGNQGQGGQGNGPGQRRQGQQQGQADSDQRQGPGNGSGTPQAMDHDWVTLTCVVVSADQRSLTVDTAEQGQVALSLGPPGFAEQQNVIFIPADTVTILGFAGENGAFQAGQITNEATQAKLHLRDPNGRPLWAGRGQGGGRGQGQQGHN